MVPPLFPKTIEFRGDELVAVQLPTGEIYVLFTRLCENLGLTRVAQTRRVQRHTILNEGIKPITLQTEERGEQTALCLRLDLLPLWLSGIQASRVKLELQEKLIHYQKEAAQVLWQAFKPHILIEEAITPVDDQPIRQLQQVAELGQAITRLANEQIELYRQQQQLAGRMDKAARIVKEVRTELTDVQIRLGILEERLHPSTYITDEQATEVKLAVQALAEVLASRSGESYQAVYRELNSRFGISSYKLIRQEQFTSVLKFIEEWRQAAQKEQR